MTFASCGANRACRYLLSLLELIAKTVFDVIVTPDSALQNVTEWGKKELCWKRAINAEVQLDLARKLRSLLIDRENDLAIQRGSRKEQRIDNGIENQQLVVQLGSQYWTKARDWAAEQAITTPDEDGILRVAASMPRRIPTEKQSWRLIQIKEKLELEGFPKPELHSDLSNCQISSFRDSMHFQESSSGIVDSIPKNAQSSYNFVV